MLANMHMMGLIPARGGSKGIPDKNLTLLQGKSLLARTCEQACAATRLTRVVVSTDTERIACCARDHGAEVPFIRPEALAQDDTPMLEVVQHALETLREQERYQPDIVVLLQPTSPLRTPQHIDAAVELLVVTGCCDTIRNGS